MTKLNHRRLAWIRDLTTTDVVSLIAILAIAAGLLNIGVDSLRGETKSSQLHSFIRTLNKAVYVFRASGGDLSDALTPDQVIAKMQATEVDRLTLTVNSILIHGLKPVYQTSEEARTDASRAFWNVEFQSFEVTERGGRGIKTFRKLGGL